MCIGYAENLYYREVGGDIMEYKTVVIDYSPKADEMAKKIEIKANEMAALNYYLVTMSVTGTAKAILVFKKDKE